MRLSDSSRPSRTVGRREQWQGVSQVNVTEPSEVQCTLLHARNQPGMLSKHGIVCPYGSNFSADSTSTWQNFEYQKTLHRFLLSSVPMRLADGRSWLRRRVIPLGRILLLKVSPFLTRGLWRPWMIPTGWKFMRTPATRIWEVRSESFLDSIQGNVADPVGNQNQQRSGNTSFLSGFSSFLLRKFSCSRDGLLLSQLSLYPNFLIFPSS